MWLFRKSSTTSLPPTRRPTLRRRVRLPRTGALLLVLLALLRCTGAAASCPVYKWSWITSSYVGSAVAGTLASGDSGCNDINNNACSSVSVTEGVIGVGASGPVWTFPHARIQPIAP
jgi:hypothetical protein